MTNPAQTTMTDTTPLDDPARHVDDDAEMVAGHADADVGMVGDDFFDVEGSIGPKGFKGAQSKGYRVERVGTVAGGKPCTRFVLDV